MNRSPGERRSSAVLRPALLGLLAVVLAGCGSGGASSTASSGAHHSASASAPTATSAFDSIAVLGHSGATGYNSDPAKPQTDVLANSWVTGTNPAVDSLYLRLLATHPALEGHAFNYAADGTGVDDLAAQVTEMLAHARPLPDLVVIMSIDNDMACDGTDPANYAPFAKELDSVLTTIDQQDKGVQVYVPDQAVAESQYVAALAQDPKLLQTNIGSGPCDAFTSAGKLRPQAVAYYQQVVDAYFARVKKVCAAHPGCFTDDGRMQGLQIEPTDLVPDANHFTVSGLAKEAALEWTLLPDSVKNGP